MAQYIDKAAVVAKIKSLQEGYKTVMDDRPYYDGLMDASEEILKYLNALKVKEEEEDTSLEKFKSLQHISGGLNKTLDDWGYAPSLYYFDGSWLVDWISYEGDSIKSFTGETPEEAIDKACEWFHSTFCNS